MLSILLFIPATLAGTCFIGFAIRWRIASAHRRCASRAAFTKIADAIGSDLMKIVFNIKEDDARNLSVIADCTGDNAGDSVGPSADGFERPTASPRRRRSRSSCWRSAATPSVQVSCWCGSSGMRIAMIIASGLSYFVNETIAKWQIGERRQDGELRVRQSSRPLVSLTSFISVAITYLVSYFLVPDPRRRVAVVEAVNGHHLRHAACRRDHPEAREGVWRTESGHVKEVVISSREGGASLNILSGPGRG